MQPTPTLLNNRYQVLRTLGAGGFGNTFLAEDTYMPSKRRCVIKQLKPVTHDPQAHRLVQERFQREAAVLEELGDGNSQIPRLYAYFLEAGQFYLVQEFIEGDTLTEKVRQRSRFGEDEVREILVSLLPVLEYVHSRRMIHRDIKPDNIIVRQQDGLPVLIDFGAVKEAMTTVVNAPGNSAESIVIGTPGFMASEQATGRPTYASDLYSLGLTAVFLLTGKLPEVLGTDARTGEILWHQEVPNIDFNLARVIDRAIRFNPGDRFASAREMLEALRSPRTQETGHTVAIAPVPQGQTPLTQPGANAALPQASPDGRRVIRQANPYKPLLIAGGLAIAALVVGLGLSRALNRSSPVVTSEPTIEEPTSPSPASQPAEISPEGGQRQAATPPVVQVPTPTPTQSAEPVQIPSPPPETTPPSTNLPSTIPGFAPGVEQQVVEATLGEPTKVSKGLWNTRAVLYEDVVPGQITLGYLFDPSGRLRQTEASFSQAVELETMSATLTQMLNGNAPAYIQEGLAAVYERQANRYAFESDRVKGVIERNNRDRVYVGVWEADLH